MASFPAAIVSLNNPTATDKMNIVPHSTQHIDVNDEVEAIETALGVNLGNVLLPAVIDTDATLTADSDVLIPSQKAVKAYADAIALSGGGIPIGYLDTDATLAASSDTRVPSQAAVKTYVDAKPSQAALLLAAWPVNSVYTSIVDTDPGTLFGGTWAAFGAGRCLVGVDVGQTEFATVEKTGGAKTHTLTSTEMPVHTHTMAFNSPSSGTGNGFDDANGTGTKTTGSTGGGAAHNNLQPYITVYFFKRTA
jgi:hypothetical protein